MFASDITASVPITSSTLGEVAVTIRKLSGRALRQAAEARSDADEVRMLRTSRMFREAGLSLADMVAEKAAPAKGDGDAPAQSAPPAPAPLSIEQLQRVRYATFDRTTVLMAGVKSWTADRPVTREAIENLEEHVEDALFRAIVDLSLPPLDPAVAEGARKNA